MEIIVTLLYWVIIVDSTITMIVVFVSIVAHKELPEIIFLFHRCPHVLVQMLILAAPELLIKNDFAPVCTFESDLSHACARSLLKSSGSRWLRELLRDGKDLFHVVHLVDVYAHDFDTALILIVRAFLTLIPCILLFDTAIARRGLLMIFSNAR